VEERYLFRDRLPAGVPETSQEADSPTALMDEVCLLAIEVALAYAVLVIAVQWERAAAGALLMHNVNPKLRQPLAREHRGVQRTL
jgi:hypothetical protein